MLFGTEEGYLRVFLLVGNINFLIKQITSDGQNERADDDTEAFPVLIDKTLGLPDGFGNDKVLILLCFGHDWGNDFKKQVAKIYYFPTPARQNDRIMLK